jgi:hypothetical protein
MGLSVSFRLVKASRNSTIIASLTEISNLKTYVPNKPLPLIKLADFGLSTQKIIMETIAGTK